MTPILTVNLLRTLFVTFCGAIGANISSEFQGNVWPGLFLLLWHCFLLGALVYSAWRKPALLLFCGALIALVGAVVFAKKEL